MFQYSFVILTFLLGSSSFALNQSSISGTVSDQIGVAVNAAKVRLLGADGRVLRESVSGAAGDFEFFPVDFGDYQIEVNVPGYVQYKSNVHVASGAVAQEEVKLLPSSGHPQEMTISVKAKKNLVSGSAPSSTREVNREMIQKLPQGDDVKLPKLIATTTPGVVAGPFGQTFIRGNHASIQYQIDGVQLPDSPSNTFGQAFSPRNIDHMEVITGGIPAEYGERLAAVVNIITKSGSEACA